MRCGILQKGMALLTHGRTNPPKQSMIHFSLYWDQIQHIVPPSNISVSILHQKVMFSFFKGSTNALSLNHTWSCESMCEFEYGWYPFDVQNCFIHGELPGEVILMTRFKNVTYSGHHDLGKYQFRGLRYCNVNKYGRLGVFVDMSFKRPLTGHFVTLFLPTGMLLLISQMSTTFSSTFLEMVIEVNTTLLLVLTTL